jgi:hypothetical protein
LKRIYTFDIYWVSYLFKPKNRKYTVEEYVSCYDVKPKIEKYIEECCDPPKGKQDFLSYKEESDEYIATIKLKNNAEVKDVPIVYTVTVTYPATFINHEVVIIMEQGNKIQIDVKKLINPEKGFFASGNLLKNHQIKLPIKSLPQTVVNIMNLSGDDVECYLDGLYPSKIPSEIINESESMKAKKHPTLGFS